MFGQLQRSSYIFMRNPDCFMVGVPSFFIFGAAGLLLSLV